ncbi:hypothetical protein, partial [Streptomyces himastatinicus]|uniref:hypothetical protein n=1 Tax=Streptomyces himastatinicus TaxID=998084 RepID=UPI001FE10F67
MPIHDRTQHGHQTRLIHARRDVHHRRHRKPAHTATKAQHELRDRQQRHPPLTTTLQLRQRPARIPASTHHRGQPRHRAALEDLPGA